VYESQPGRGAESWVWLQSSPPGPRP